MSDANVLPRPDGVTEEASHEQQEALRKALIYAEEVIATLREPFLVLDKDLRVKTANRSFYQTFQSSKEATEAHSLFELGNGQWDNPRLRTLLEDVVPGNHPINDYEVEHTFPSLGPRVMLLNARRFPPEGQHTEMILLAIEDVTEERRLEAGLKVSEVRYRRLFQTAQDGILILDAATGTITDANPFMSGLLGYELADLLGKELWEIGLFRDKEENQATYRKLQEVGYVRYEHLPLKTNRGNKVEVEFVSNVYEADHRQVVQCNIRDITERAQLMREMQSKTVALADLNRRKDEFLAMLSHELRNPLAPILNALHLLRLQGDENPFQQQGRSMIERQVGQLTHLIDDLLEVSRIATGRVRLRQENLDMRGIAERAVDTTRPLIERKKHELSVSLPPSPVWLHADPTRLEQVAVNLLNNAAKYTDEGGRIAVSVRQEGDQMVLRVGDTGVGIAPEMLSRIFDLFTQAEGSLERSQGGLGIGLALVQRIVELQGGTVEARSEGLGHGSEFIVRLPVVLSPASPPPTVTVPTERRAQGRRILVVDDNVDAAQSLAMLLRMSGYDVRTAYTGPTALEAAVAYLPNLVLLDLGLPGLNGYEVARRLRATPQLQGMRLVAVTGWGREADRQLCLEAGFDRHMVKPVAFAAVQEVLAELDMPMRSART